MKSSISIMHENYEGSSSWTLRTRNSRRPSRMLVRNWKHRWLPLCLAKFLRTIRIVGVVHPVKSKQNLRVFWELMNPQDCVWENLLPTHHEDHFAGKGDNSLPHYNLVHKLIPMPQAMKIPAAEAAADKEWEKLEIISA